MLAKGNSSLQLLPLLIEFFKDKYLLQLDLSKAYNSVRLDESDYYLQCVYFKEGLPTDEEPDIWILVTMTYGLTSSMRTLDFAMLDIAEKERQIHIVFANMLLFFRFVDDMENTAKSREKRDEMEALAIKLFAKYGFNVKGALKSGQPPPPNLDLGDGLTSVLGYLSLIHI